MTGYRPNLPLQVGLGNRAHAHPSAPHLGPHPNSAGEARAGNAVLSKDPDAAHCPSQLSPDFAAHGTSQLSPDLLLPICLSAPHPIVACATTCPPSASGRWGNLVQFPSCLS